MHLAQSSQAFRGFMLQRSGIACRVTLERAIGIGAMLLDYPSARAQIHDRIGDAVTVPSCVTSDLGRRFTAIRGRPLSQPVNL